MEIKQLKDGYKFNIHLSFNRIEILDSKKNIVWYHSFGISNTNISCGIQQLHSCIRDSNVDGLKECLKPRTSRKVVLTKMMQAFIRTKKAKLNCAMMLVSNNKASGLIFNSILDKIAIKSCGYMRNPNSGNQIKLWIL